MDEEGPRMMLLLSARFPDLQTQQKLGGELTNAQALPLLKNAQTLMQRKLYAYAPLDEAKLTAYASKRAAFISTLAQFAAHVQTLKPSLLEKELQAFVREDRDPEFLVTKKCDPALYVALGAYFKPFFEQLFPPAPFKPEGKPSKDEFRFAAQLQGWTMVRKASLDVAERKEIFACLAATYEGVSRKVADFSSSNPQADAKALADFLARYPGRRSLARLATTLAAMAKENTLSTVSEGYRSYFLQKVMASCGYPPYCSIEVVNGVYPELKIPKPRGRQKKA